MSSLWTPDGERLIRRDPADPADPAGSAAFKDTADEGYPAGQGEPSPDELEAIQEELQQMQAELAAVPAAAVIANHTIGLFQLAAVHLQAVPPNLPDAQVSIDAMAAIVDGCRGRLGPDEGTLVDALSQIRLAFVQVAGALGPH